MAKRVVNLNMKDVSVGGVIPEGEYIVTVDEVSVEESQQGNQYLKWVFKVIDGPQKNSKIYHNTSLLPQSLFNLKNLLIALGVPVPDKAFQLNLDECEGCNCGVTVTHETYDGKKRSRVTDVFPLDASDVEDTDEEADEEVDLEEMSLEELIEFADENDIKLTAKQKKRKSAALAAIQDALGDEDEEEDEEADEEEADDEDTESEEEESDEDEEEEPALEDMDLEALIEFAEENEIKLTAKQKKRKSAALAAIQEALDDSDEEEEEDDDEDEEADEVDVFTLNLSECRSFAKDNGISLAKMPVKDRKNLDKVREYIQEKLDEAI